MIERKVIWIEGMFLRQHHFQQQDRRTESLIWYLVRTVQPFGWGYSRLKLDESALRSGSFGIESCEGMMPDGLCFAYPGDAGVISAIPVDGTLRDTSVYLALPSIAVGARLGDRTTVDGKPSSTRFVVEDQEVKDAMEPGQPPDKISLGMPSLRLVLGDRPPEGFSSLQIARIREVNAGNVILDQSFVPPVLSVDVARDLANEVREIASLFNSRAERFADDTKVFESAGASANDHFTLLQVCNRWAARLGHMIARRRNDPHAAEDRAGGRALVHPADLHLELVEAAAELATFTNEETFRAPEFPPYDHDRLSEVFQPVLEELRRSLTQMIISKAQEIPLSFGSKNNIYFNQDVPNQLLRDARMILVVKADMVAEELRQELPQRVNIGAIDEMRSIMAAANRSVKLMPLPSNPPGLKPLQGASFFELDTTDPDWRKVVQDRTLAIQIQDIFPDLELKLWAIRS